MINNDDIMVSIDCLTYCHEKYIRQCLDGFLMQKTNFKFEVLIHDDASPDGTADIIREYAEKYPDIIKPIYQTENQYSKGIPITAKFQVPRIKGKYVAICEGDDFWTDPYKLQKQFDAMETYPECRLCVHQVMRTDECGMVTAQYSEKYSTGVFSQKSFFSIMDRDYFGTPFQTSSYFVRKADFVTLYANPPEFKQVSVVGDMPILLYSASLGTVYYFEDAMSCYRNGVPTSFTSTAPKETSSLIRLYDSRLNTYLAFEEYCGGKYKLNHLIARTRLKSFILKSEYKLAWKYARFRPYACQTFSDYLRLFMQARIPWLYRLQRKIRKKDKE